jgi:hypothetical protein
MKFIFIIAQLNIFHIASLVLFARRCLSAVFEPIMHRCVAKRSESVPSGDMEDIQRPVSKTNFANMLIKGGTI